MIALNKECPKCGERVRMKKRVCHCGYVFYASRKGLEGDAPAPTKLCPSCGKANFCIKKQCVWCKYEFQSLVPNSEIAKTNSPFKIGQLLREINRLRLAITKLEGHILRKEILVQEAIAVHFKNEC